MKKIKLLLVISVSTMIFTSCGNKYSIENLKKNDKLLKETVLKCKEKRDEKICKNVEQAQNELAQEWWSKMKPEISKKVDKISKDAMAGDASSSMENVPEKLWEWEAKHLSTTPQKAKEMTLQLLKDVTQNMKFEKYKDRTDKCWKKLCYYTCKKYNFGSRSKVRIKSKNFGI